MRKGLIALLGTSVMLAGAGCKQIEDRLTKTTEEQRIISKLDSIYQGLPKELDSKTKEGVELYEPKNSDFEIFLITRMYEYSTSQSSKNKTSKEMWENLGTREKTAILYTQRNFGEDLQAMKNLGIN